MKIGIDSYCYHRFFGEVYPDQEPAQKKMTMQDFLKNRQFRVRRQFNSPSDLFPFSSRRPIRSRGSMVRSNRSPSIHPVENNSTPVPIVFLTCQSG